MIGPMFGCSLSGKLCKFNVFHNPSILIGPTIASGVELNPRECRPVTLRLKLGRPISYILIFIAHTL